MPSMTLTCFVCNLPMKGSRTSKPQGLAAHNSCRGPETTWTHGKSGYRRGCRCAECREGARVSMAAYAVKVKARDGVSPTQKARPKMAAGQKCTVCQGELKRVALSDSPIHKGCRTRRTPGLLHKRFQAKIDKAARGTTGGGRVFTCGDCARCGEYFVGVGKYCSPRCRGTQKTVRRNSGGGFKLSPRDRLALYERDGWVCQLCWYPVTKGLNPLDDWAASLDHIIPQSTMLVPDHSSSNLRLSHRWCNSSRGDGSNMTEAEFQRRVSIHFEGVAA